MCNFLSLVIYRDGAIFHDQGNSHSAAVKQSGRAENTMIHTHFWEWEWDGIGNIPPWNKLLRITNEEPPQNVKDIAERYAAYLQQALEEGKHLDTKFANFPSVKAQSKNFVGCIEYANGTKLWYKNGQPHREDGPAVEYANGTKLWYKNGQYHREDGPAAEYANGTKLWYKNGQYHRENGPAIEYADGTKEWYKNDQYHREDGPAIEYADDTKCWYKNGERHREDGPAIERADGTKEWYKNGQFIKHE